VNVVTFSEPSVAVEDVNPAPTEMVNVFGYRTMTTPEPPGLSPPVLQQDAPEVLAPPPPPPPVLAEPGVKAEPPPSEPEPFDEPLYP
jgi:hypothetical protein